jgi:mannosyl-oligosaccharide glucosidase
MQGDQYWTGPIWININYLVLRALKTYYMDSDGPYFDRVSRIYDDLKSNIVENMTDIFTKTGTIWEQYSDMNGNGQRSRPFTGWSALLVLIASEKY